MGRIIVYNTSQECHTSDPNNYYIGRGSVLGCPFTFNGKRSNLAKLTFRTRQECLEAYDKYFDISYDKNHEFRNAVDLLFGKYKNGEDLYLQCFCKPEPCHGDIIAKKLQQMLVKDKLQKIKMKNEER